MPSDYDDIKGIDYSQLRKHKRYDLHLPCTIKSCDNEKEVFHTLLTTISVGGVSLINEELLGRGKFYIVSFHMPNGSSVVKKVEIRWQEMDVLEVTHEGKFYKGFEHGCKFIIVNTTDEDAEKSEAPSNNAEKKVAEEEPGKLEVETLKDCFYHIEFLRDGGSKIRHGYVNKLGTRTLFFQTLTPLRQNEIIDSNVIRIEESELAEQREKLLINEINKEGRQYSVKATILE